MKKKELQTMRNKTKKELAELASEKANELEKAVVELKVSKEKDLKKAKNTRKELSQLLTLVREKEILEEESQVAEEKGVKENK